MSLYDYDETIICGRVGKDAEMRYLSSGDAVTSFSVAVDRSYKKNDETVKKTIQYRVSVFGKFAEICNSIQKGERVLVVGNLNPDKSGGPRVWTKQDGTSAASFEINANVVRFLSDKKKSENKSAPVADDIPF